MTRSEHITWKALELFAGHTEKQIESLLRKGRVDEAEMKMEDLAIAQELIKEVKDGNRQPPPFPWTVTGLDPQALIEKTRKYYEDY